MNHVPMKMAASALAQPAKVTRRALAKQRTREKIVASARELFAERGYEGATIRDIARVAGLSTGAVFASFADKAELFEEIVAADYQALEAAMRQAVLPDAPVAEALLALFDAATRLRLDQLQLARASIAASWTRDIETERREREALRPILDLVREALQRGVERRELQPGINPRLVAGMLWDLHLAGLRAAVFDGRTAAELAARFGDRLEVIMTGVRA